MNNTTVYLAGGMTNLSIEDQTEWRNKATEVLAANGFVVLDPVKTKFLNPKDREITTSNKYMIKHSDIILAEFIDGRPVSMGTCGEVIHNDNHKPVIAFGTAPIMDHPWIADHLTASFPRIDDALNYIVQNYRR